jgi:hypothetical protein
VRHWYAFPHSPLFFLFCVSLQRTWSLTNIL